MCNLAHYKEKFPFVHATQNVKIEHGGPICRWIGPIDCLSLDPFFYADLTPNDPFFLQSTPSDPLFSTFVSNLTCKWQIFCTLSANFEKFKNFAAILTYTKQIWLEIAFLHTEFPSFLEVHTKKKTFFGFWSPHQMAPFFRRSLTPNAPYFHSAHVRRFHIQVPPPPAKWNCLG